MRLVLVLGSKVHITEHVNLPMNIGEPAFVVKGALYSQWRKDTLFRDGEITSPKKKKVPISRNDTIHKNQLQFH